MSSKKNSGSPSRHAPLRPSEAAAFMNLAQSAAELRTEHDFRDWCTTDLQAFLPFELGIFTIARRFGSRIVVDDICGLNYPDQTLQGVSRHMEVDSRLVVKRWLATGAPQVVTTGESSALLSEEEKEEFCKHKQVNIAAHGVMDFTGEQASFFTLSRVHGPMDPALKLKLQVLAPHIHQARCAIAAHKNLARDTVGPHQVLSPRETEVLRWMAKGLTNAQIAQNLSRSPMTIKSQVKSILGKLEVANRTQAVRWFVENSNSIPATGDMLSD